MKQHHIVPTIFIVGDLIQAVICFLTGDKMDAGYWVSAALITFFVSFRDLV